MVLAIFSDEASADMAAASLKDSSVEKGDAIGVPVLYDKGKIKTDKVGKCSMGKGAGIGTALALVTPACSRPACWATFTTRTWDSTRPIVTA